MEFWQTIVILPSFWAVAMVGASLAKRNWSNLAHGSLVQSGGATLMADEWHLSSEAREALRQAFWLLIGVVLLGEGVVFAAVSIHALLFG